MIGSKKAVDVTNRDLIGLLDDVAPKPNGPVKSTMGGTEVDAATQRGFRTAALDISLGRRARASVVDPTLGLMNAIGFSPAARTGRQRRDLPFLPTSERHSLCGLSLQVWAWSAGLRGG